ncbi:MAG: MATE family efflux transporter [Candidatus Methanoperedens sp.]
MIPAAVSMSLFVEGSHSLPLKESVVKSLKLIVLLMVPALVFIYFFGDRLLLLFSSEYSEQSFEMLQLLAVSSIFSAVTSIFISIKKIQRDVKMINYANFALSVMIIGFGYVALLKYGLIGLGYAWLGANIVVCVLICEMVVKSKYLQYYTEL